MNEFRLLEKICALGRTNDWFGTYGLLSGYKAWVITRTTPAGHGDNTVDFASGATPEEAIQAAADRMGLQG